jgi:hypothetical protein
MSENERAPLTKKELEDIIQLKNAGWRLSEIAKETGFTRTRICRNIDGGYLKNPKKRQARNVMPRWVVFENITKAEARQVRNKRN